MNDDSIRDEREFSHLINRYDFAMASKAIAGYVEKGYGLDGMPLQRGQSPLSSSRETKSEGG